MKELRVSGNKRHLTHDGKPFFWLGDTAWELFHALSREEMARYFDDRAQKGFNVVQAVLLAEIRGLDTPNAYGRFPLLKNAGGSYDPALPDLSGEYSYWDHAEHALDLAEARGMFVALLPTWGDKYNKMWGDGPEIFDGGSAYAYAKWLGGRYKHRANIVWVLGGDREYTERRHFEVVTAMARGIRDAGATQLITAHPCGRRSTTHQLANEPWMDFDMIQSGHGTPVSLSWSFAEKDWARGARPVIDAEPNYEDHPIAHKTQNGFFDAYDVRRASYWAVFAGSAGVTYGHHCVWGFNRRGAPPLKEQAARDPHYFLMDWTAALDRPGAGQMRHLKALMEDSGFGGLAPDQTLLLDNVEGANHQRAMRGGGVTLFYSPAGTDIHAAPDALAGVRSAAWFNPSTGAKTPARTPENGCFVCPGAGRGEDWALILSK